ncbi:MAG: YCF48-related protein, partial [Actinomycetes bacterium]
MGALVLAAAILLPISASGYISTGQPATDRNWLWQNPLPQGNDLRSASWYSNSVGWAVGVTGTVLKTNDGGATWAVEDPKTNRDLTGVSFVDANNGWICGVSATVLRTTDGGANWTAQTATTVPAARNLRGISFYNTSAGVAVGDTGNTTSTIVFTNNGGTTWRTAAATTTVGLSGVQMVSSTVGWAVGGAGTILKTVDGGASWESQPSPTTAGLSAVSFAPGGLVGYVVGNAVLPNWTIYKTIDGGVTWNAVSGLGSTGAINLTGVHALDPSNAVAVGTNGQVRHTSDGGATWLNQSVNNLQSNALRDVKMIDASNIKLIGDFGVTFYTRSGGNFWFTSMLGTNATYYSASFVDANHGWLAGSNGTIMRTADAGASWESQASGITNWRGIHFTDANNGWVVGDGGQIQHTTNGVDWAPQTSGTTVQLNGVWFTDNLNGCAVGNNGTVLNTTNGGATWVIRPSTVTQSLNAVWFANASTGWAVGASGVILKTTSGGNSWNAQSTPTAQTLLAVRGVSQLGVWVSGNAGAMAKTTNGGTAWSLLTPGAALPNGIPSLGASPIRTLYFVDANNGWFASNYGIVGHTTDGGAHWTQQFAGLPTVTTDAVTGLWSMWFADSNTGYIVGDAATIRRTTDGGTSWASLQFGTLNSLMAIDFADSLNGWISGTSGMMLHTSDAGQTWPIQKTGTGSALNGLSVVTSQTVWAAGDNGAIRRTNDGGQTWAGQVSGTTVNLSGISAYDGSRAIAVGQSGTVKYTTTSGAAWATGSIATTQPLSSVTMPDASHAWAVGGRIAGNNVVWYTADGGASWASQTTTANANLWDVYFLSPTEGYATGDSGIILKTTNSGVNWIKQTTPTTLPLYSIEFKDATNGMAVGGGGVVVRTANGGTTWTLQSSGTARTLTGSTYADATRAWIAGGQGTVLRNTNVTPPVTTLTTAPAGPDGANNWYKTDPSVALLSSTAPLGTTWYSWASAAGPFIQYSIPVPVPQGTPSLYYYSIDGAGNIEAVKTASFAVDYTAPTAPTNVTASYVGTSTAQIQWTAGTDALSGVDHYSVAVNSGTPFSVSGTSTALTGLTDSTLYAVTVSTVDVAGNVSAAGTVSFTTGAVDHTPFTTLLNASPAGANGKNGWYVTTPTVTLAVLPMATPDPATLYSWDSLSGPYVQSTPPATTAPSAAGTSTLYFSTHDLAGVRAIEPTQQATFLLDPLTPAAPVVTAAVMSYASVHLSWPRVADTPSGIAEYDVYQDGSLVTTTTDIQADIV